MINIEVVTLLVEVNHEQCHNFALCLCIYFSLFPDTFVRLQSRPNPAIEDRVNAIILNPKQD